ncbi:SDR family oxidoreductase [Nocardioides nitrophenolicus]|uniref:SDR family oxidoreductase n=1 Tax=Nocardioides nitrophenolicus TaxID=60489 RepID=UPI000AA44264|nr:SDR family oxidoreductase [Nocardioides nitrophenolicus]MBM7518632.1 uncharacterized protein YbjT (DUF2867 family) [Nocardioides nitrophenolicus]
MRVVVIGGTGLIGSKVVEKMRAHGHDAVAAAPQTGCNTITNEGVAEAVAGADVLVDVSNSPSFADQDVLDFFTTSTTNLLAAAKDAGVANYVALSVVGCDRLPESGYLRAKVAQEKLITESGVAFSIVRATQFFEFAKAIADSATVDGQVHLPTAYFQPMAAEDVATAVARHAAGEATKGVMEIGGPEKVRMSDFIAAGLKRVGDSRQVVPDAGARYFGTTLTDESLVPGPGSQVGTTTYADWVAAQK